MQKKIIALAIAGLVSGGAFAQSNVTISGMLDASVYYSNASESTWGFASNNNNSSRFSFKGTEDLGSGMKAFFDLTQEINLLTGGAGSGASGATATGFNDYSRGANIGLDSRAGKLTLGRQAVPSYATLGNTDALGINSGGMLDAWAYSTLLGAAGNTVPNRVTGATNGLGGTNTSGGALLPNSFAGGIGYDTPIFGGVQVKLFSTFGNGRTGASFNNNGQQDAAVTYNGYGFGAVLSHNRWRNSVAVAANGTEAGLVTEGKLTVAGLNYTMGPWKVAGGWIQQKYDASIQPALVHGTKVYGLSGSYTTGPMRFAIGWTHVKDDDNSANKANMYTFLGDYALSKRTDAYVILSTVRNDGASALNPLYGGNAPVLTNPVGSSLRDQGQTNNSIAVGYRVGF